MNSFERLAVWSSTLVAGGSGVVYAFMKYLMTTSEPYAVVNHPLQPLFLKIHVTSAPVIVFVLGVVFTRHVLGQWKTGQPRARRSGLWISLALAPMILSGHLIQATVHEDLRWWLVAVHLGTGGAYLLGLFLHRVASVSREPAPCDETPAVPAPLEITQGARIPERNSG